MNQRIFHLSGKEHLDELLEYITSSTPDTIIFLFSRKSWIFSQITDLKTLREKAEENNKTLSIVTPNHIARTTLQSVGIACYGTLEDMEKTPWEQQEEDAKKEGKTGNKKSVKKISVDPLMYKKRKGTKKHKISPPAFLTRPALHALLLLGSLAFFLALFILNIAIPESTITISPAKKEEENHINIHALDNTKTQESDLWRKNNGIFSTPFEKVFTLQKTFSNITKEFKGQNASGTIVVTNPFHESYTLQKNTRFVTSEGIIFITPKWVTLRANGKTTLQVESKQTDQYGKFQGEKANIPKGQSMTIPGLAEHIRSKIEVVNTTPMQGGKTKWIYKVHPKDLQNAKDELLLNAKIQAEIELNYILENANTVHNTDLRFFHFFTKDQDLSHQSEFEVSTITFSPDKKDIIGQEIQSFTGKITVRVKNYAYSQQDLIALMEKKFKKSAPEGMHLQSIDTSLLDPKVEKNKENGKEITASISTRGVYSYIIEPKSEEGFAFIKKATKEISGMKKDEAKTHLINNFPEVSDASITTWPTWIQRIPTLPENIRFQIKE